MRLLSLAACLCLFSALISAQNLSLQCHQALVPGCSIGAMVHAPMPNDARVSVVLAFQPGSTPVMINSQLINLPLSGPMAIVGKGKMRNGVWHGEVRIPNHPSIVGLDTYFAGVIESASVGTIATFNVPFGPILEDAIQ